MRLLHVLSQYPGRTGSGVYCRQLIQSFADRHNASADLQQALIYGCNESHPDPQIPVQTYPVVFESPNLPFPVPGMSDEMPYRSTIYHQMSDAQLSQWEHGFQEALENALEQFQPDLLICHHLWMLTSLCLRYQKPVVGICHGTDLRQARQNPELFQRSVSGLTHLKAVIVHTEEQKSEIERLYGIPHSKMMVGGGAYNDSIFYPRNNWKTKTDEEPVRFIYAGKLSASKGLMELLDAFHQRPESMKDTLEIIGSCEADQRAILEEKIGGDRRILLSESLPQDLLGERLRQGDVFVFPTYYEGLGLMAIEALACGLRLIITDLPGPRAFLGEQIWRSPRLSVLPCPPLVNQDQIEPSARTAHIQRLGQALEEQAKKVREERAQDLTLQEWIRPHSWSELSQKIWEVLEKALD